jgi:hypothetical protein
MAETGKTFGDAIQALMAGHCARRAGWNGKGMFVYRLQVPPFSIPHVVINGSPVSFAPCFCLFTAQKAHQPGWNAAQPDMQATDWEILSPSDLAASQA